MIDAHALAKMVHDEARLYAAICRYGDSPDLDAKGLFARMSSEAPLADENALAHVIAEVFWASLLKEEGRACTPRLIFEPGEDRAVHMLAEPLRLGREVLRKVSPAQGEGSGLVWDFRDGRPSIVGLRRAPLMPSRSPGVTVSATGSGAVDVTWNNVRVLTYRAGEVLCLSTAKLGNLAQVTEHVAREIGAMDTVFVLPLVIRMLKQHHGGTLWIAPADKPLTGIDLQRRLKVDHRTFRERFKDGDSHIPWLESVAALAAVDGAILMDADLRLLGFGAFVTLGERPPEIQKWVAGGGAKLVSAGEGVGGRHRSAAEFCEQFRPACAYVVSEDGAVSAFFAPKDSIVQCHPVVSIGHTFF